jgi:hypothetical protein
LPARNSAGDQPQKVDSWHARHGDYYGEGTYASLTAIAIHVTKARSGKEDVSVSGPAMFGIAGTGRGPRVSPARQAISKALESCKDLPGVVAHLQAAWDALPADPEPVTPAKKTVTVTLPDGTTAEVPVAVRAALERPTTHERPRSRVGAGGGFFRA